MSCRAASSTCCSTTWCRGSNALAFEVSERTFLSRRVRARDRLTPLRNLGVEIVVDDFGATAAATAVGPSELRDSLVELLEPLRAFPLDGIKLDPSVVDRLDGGVADVVAAAQSIDVRVVAVGVEDEVAVERARRTRASISPRDSSSIARNRPRASTVCSRLDERGSMNATR